MFFCNLFADTFLHKRTAGSSKLCRHMFRTLVVPSVKNPLKLISIEILSRFLLLLLLLMLLLAELLTMATMATERFTRIAYTLQKPRNPEDRPFKGKI